MSVLQYGSLEAGGAKICLCGYDETIMLWKKYNFQTTKPIETIDKCIEFSQNLRI